MGSRPTTTDIQIRTFLSQSYFIFLIACEDDTSMCRRGSAERTDCAHGICRKARTAEHKQDKHTSTAEKVCHIERVIVMKNYSVLSFWEHVNRTSLIK